MNISNAAFYMKNDIGEYVKVGDWNNIQTFTEAPEDVTEDSKATVYSTIPVSRECSFTLDISQKTRCKLINTFYWGWRAKGPVRKRMLKRAFWLGSRKWLFLSNHEYERGFHSKC